MAQSAGYTSITLNGTDITTSTDKFTPPIEADMTDISSFPAAGSWPSMNMKRGALNSPVTLDVFVNTTTWPVIQALDGLRTGATLVAKTGNNAAPTTGDVLFMGTYTLVKVAGKDTTGTPRKMTLTLKPTDGGAQAPTLTRI